MRLSKFEIVLTVERDVQPSQSEANELARILMKFLVSRGFNFRVTLEDAKVK